MNEQDLLLKIEGLEKIIKDRQDSADEYKLQLTETKQQLVDYNKPELTTSQMEAIERAVEQAVSRFDFTDTDNFEIDYSLDYDGRVQCESHEFINDSDLVQMIVDKVCTLFKEVEELDTTEDDNHKVTHVEKLYNMNLLTQNSKLKRTSKELGLRVFNFGIPAYKSASGKLTCPFADECVKFCYAKKGAYIWSNVKPAFEKRYQLTKTDEFIPAMIDEIVNKRPDYIRVHDSGDYYSPAYLEKWLRIARTFPEIKFYSYTNCVNMLKNVDLPDNYDIIFSDSGKQKHMIDQTIDRHTKIFDSQDELISNGYINASKIDLYATKWFNKDNINVGLIAH